MATEGDRTEGERLRPLEAVVLAGGAGRRFGGGKLLAPWRGGLLIEAALDCAFAAPARSVTLVTGADPDVMPVALEHALREGEAARLRIVHAREHAEGMAATLRAGIEALPADTLGAYVFLGDMPLIPPEVAGRLAGALEAGAWAAVPVHDGRRGHPVLFSARLFGALRALSGDEGARSVLRGLGERLVEVAAPNAGILFDVDTPADLDG
jgi:molybdenum cofactor cytidylyltransferase